MTLTETNTATTTATNTTTNTYCNTATSTVTETATNSLTPTPTFTTTNTLTPTATTCPYVYNSEWTGSGDPVNIAVGPGGYVFAVSDNNLFKKYSPTGVAATIVSSGAGGKFKAPKGIAVDSAMGFVYVADTGNNQIQSFTNQERAVTYFGGSGSGSGKFNGPMGLATYISGGVTYIYVADSGNNLIQELDSTGHFYTQWNGANGVTFNSPQGVAVDPNGNVYVVDTGNNLLWQFTSTGNYENQWGGFGTGNGLFNSPKGIAVDGYNHVFIADTGNNLIQEFYNNGVFINQFGGYGTGSGLFKSPSSVVISYAAGAGGTYGNLFVADTGNNLIQKYLNCSTAPTNTLTATRRPLTPIR